tara:strand:+ start:488 stop:1405 length:918 start_codon:yes stop_codon:yes gene_type:complete
MKIFNTFNIPQKYKKSVIAVGNFDGIHLGHKKVLYHAKKVSKIKKIKFGILTFEPIPVMFFNRNIKNHRINSLEQKKKQLLKIANFIILKKFDKTFSKLSHDYFVKKIINEKIDAKYIFVSKNFRYGRNRLGNVKNLKKLEKNFNYKTVITKPLKKKNKTISSSKIRKFLRQGKIKEANLFLGKKWSVTGKVEKGDQRGRKLGFPTCNLDLKDYVIPKFGVYAVDVMLNNTNLKKGIANVGIRPTFKGKKLLLEVHIFGIKKNLYGKHIIVQFKRFIRSEKKFKNFNDLKKQIKLDIINSKKKNV